MAKRIFVTGTGTDVGKTYISSLILKGLVEEGKNCAYYKAALSGADNISVIVVCNLKLGSINSTVLTIEYLKNKKIKIKGIVVNNYEKSLMEDDNMKMIREITKIPIIGIVKKNDKKSLHILKSCSSI